MKFLGALLVLGGAAEAWLLVRREGLAPIRLGRALLGDLSVLRCEICLHRAPLPQILEEKLTNGPGAQRLWTPLAEVLRERGDLPRSWALVSEALPKPLDALLAPLGPLLPVGGERLGSAIEEVRGALTAFLEAETARQAERSRLAAGLCLAGAALVILVLI